jgi:hypothetical protein
MNKYKKNNVKSDEYNELLGIQIKNNAPIREQCIGSRKILYSHNKMLISTIKSSSLPLGELPEKMFYSFLGGFSKHLYKQFSKNDALFNLDIQFKGISKAKNYEFWDTLEDGKTFYNIDLSSAYWQMANKLGYISDKYFEDYQDSDTYKQAKRYCISFLARKNYMTYNSNGLEYKIECDTNVLKKVYENIRNYLYLSIEKSMDGISNYIEYNIDGVSVLAKDVDIVKVNMLSMGLKFKLTQCRKISATEYIYNFKQRKF